MIRPEVATGALIALAVAVGVLRSVLHRSDVSSWLRIAICAALSATAGALLQVTLFPPPTWFARGTWVVATAGTPADTRAGPGERLIVLPEAPRLAGAERVPDLATALRRHGQPERIRVAGAGLIARDRAAATGVRIDFAPPPLPRGLTALQPPPMTAAGAAFAVGGQVSGFRGASAELLDPAGRRIDARAVDRDGRFVLVGDARAPGMALFDVRIRDTTRAVVAAAAVPLWTVANPKLRVLAIGAPGPEPKYLRRWAADAGIDYTSPLEAGGGVRLGDAPVPLVPATLRRYDAVIIDDRSWQALGDAARGALAGAVGNGLGLILRMTGPATPAARRSWASLGLTVGGGDELRPIALAPLAIDADALAARRGPVAPDQAGAGNALDDPAPELGRWTIGAGAALVPLLRDGAGNILAVWGSRGLGRVALWAVADSYALVLSGQRERHFQWWSEAVTTVARATPQFAPDLPAIARVGERMAICGVAGQPRVVGSVGRETQLAVDGPAGASGCAAFWPRQAGLHTLIQPGRDGVRSRPFHVYPANALPALAGAELAQATVALAAASRTVAARGAGGERPGPAWPWFLGWLAVSAALWTLERRWRPASSA